MDTAEIAYLQGQADAAQAIIELVTESQTQHPNYDLHYALNLREAARTRGVKPIEAQVDMIKAAAITRIRCA